MYFSNNIYIFIIARTVGASFTFHWSPGHGVSNRANVFGNVILILLGAPGSILAVMVPRLEGLHDCVNYLYVINDIKQ